MVDQVKLHRNGHLLCERCTYKWRVDKLFCVASHGPSTVDIHTFVHLGHLQ